MIQPLFGLQWIIIKEKGLKQMNQIKQITLCDFCDSDQN